ncbi:LacI family DNA-binding transcriptional regulator [Streptomyces sp. HK10]|uniref:LacI family DNA-binding transcriptional regulator n=1 Tax=Streptomyces sp. HK10 TaxID=3373255 RepID=UPI00374A5153
MRLTTADVARAAGVSGSAVSRALNAEGGVDGRVRHPGFPSVATTNALGDGQAAHRLPGLGRRRPLAATGPVLAPQKPRP